MSAAEEGTCEGIDQLPGVAGKSGDITAAALYAGGLGYGGMREDDDASAPFTRQVADS